MHRIINDSPDLESPHPPMGGKGILYRPGVQHPTTGGKRLAYHAFFASKGPRKTTRGEWLGRNDDGAADQPAPKRLKTEHSNTEDDPIEVSDDSDDDTVVDQTENDPIEVSDSDSDDDDDDAQSVTSEVAHDTIIELARARAAQISARKATPDKSPRRTRRSLQAPGEYVVPEDDRRTLRGVIGVILGREAPDDTVRDVRDQLNLLPDVEVTPHNIAQIASCVYKAAVSGKLVVGCSVCGKREDCEYSDTCSACMLGVCATCRAQHSATVWFRRRCCTMRNQSCQGCARPISLHENNTTGRCVVCVAFDITGGVTRPVMHRGALVGYVTEANRRYGIGPK